MEHQDGTFDSALTERGGIDQPQNVNPHFVVKKVQKITTAEYVEGILKGDRTMLSRAITLIESSNPNHLAQAQEIIEQCLPHAGKSIRIGITGVPGAGKSSLIETLGTMLAQKNRELAVLAIDPSSERSKGSILGDKVRMEQLSVEKNAFIRPSPSAGSLGGVARKTRESVILCEAAGFDVIFIETVGVGQSEITVHGMVDFFLLVQIPNAGDELQGIKRGIMEMADMIAINKSDGDRISNARIAKAQLQNALHLFPTPESGWLPPVLMCSAYTKEGVWELWDAVEAYVKHTKENGYFEYKRREQLKNILKESIEEQLKQRFYQRPEVKEYYCGVLNDIMDGRVNPYMEAQKMMEKFD